MSALKTGTIAAALVAAFSWPAVAQTVQCAPTLTVIELLTVQGFQPHDQIIAPNGDAVQIVCHPGVGAGGVVVHSVSDGVSCFLTPRPVAGMCAPPVGETDEES